MRIPIPRIPRWFDRSLDWLNADCGPRLWGFQARRIDPIGLAFGLMLIVLDGQFVHGWEYALTIDPLMLVLGFMIVHWFF